MAAANGVVVACAGCGAKNRKDVTRAGAAVCAKCGRDLPRGGGPVAVDGAAFDAVLKAASVPVLVDFWASWCGPCRAFAPVLEQFAGRHAADVLVLKVDTEANPGIAQRFGISAIPTTALFRGGREVARQSGAMPLAALEAWVARETGGGAHAPA